MLFDQQQCALLRAPTEIRHQNYHHVLPHGIHAFERDGRFVLSTRIQSEPNTSEVSATTRRAMFPTPAFNLRAARIRYTLGPHWGCEDLTLETSRKVKRSHKETRRMRLDVWNVCKQMEVYLY